MLEYWKVLQRIKKRRKHWKSESLRGIKTFHLSTAVIRHLYPYIVVRFRHIDEDPRAFLSTHCVGGIIQYSTLSAEVPWGRHMPIAPLAEKGLESRCLFFRNHRTKGIETCP